MMKSNQQDTIVADLSEACDASQSMVEASLAANQFNQQGIRYVQSGQLPKAEFSFNEAIKLDPAFGSAYNNLGLVFYHQHDFLEALRAFTAASEHMPESPEPLNNLGLVMESVARPYDAIELYRRAHELDPTSPEYLGNFLRARIRLNDVDDEVLDRLHFLLLIEKRLEWQDWAREQLALHHNPNLDRGPAKPSTDPLGELTNNRSSNSTSSSSSSSSTKNGSTAPRTDAPSNGSRVIGPPDEMLRLPTVPPEELPSFEPLQLPSPSVPLPPTSSSMRPTPAEQPPLLPPSIPASSRRQGSILESLE